MSSDQTNNLTPIVSPMASAYLPAVETELTPAQMMERLDEAARRGKLPGFSRAHEDALFTVTDFGGPFESVLEAAVAPGPSDANGTRLEFSLRLKRGMIIVFVVVMVATVWPGVWLTDSMLRTYFTGYDFQTWMWYLPLTAPFVPWSVLSAVRKSRRSGREQAIEIIGKVRGLLPPPGASGGTGAPAGPIGTGRSTTSPAIGRSIG